MRFLGAREEFAAKRKSVLDRAEARLSAVIKRALTHYGEKDWYAPIVTQAIKVYSAMYEEEAGETAPTANLEAYTSKISKSLAKTKKPTKTTASTLQRYIATNAVNAATVHAADNDPEELVLEWVTMHDSHVRDTHKAADGQRRKKGEPFHVGDSEMDFPGDTSAPPDEWIGCRCVARADLPDAASISALTAAAVDTSNLTVVVALPTRNDPVNALGPEQSHVTLLFLGPSDALDGEQLNTAVSNTAAAMVSTPDMIANVEGRDVLGDDEAQVLMLNGEQLAEVRDHLLSDPYMAESHASVEQYPTWIPHLTLGYPGDTISDETPQEIRFDRIALWHGDTQTEHPLGGDVTAPTDQEAPEEAPVDEAETANVSPPAAIPWHGVAAPEGAMSGDGRGFKPGSLRNRDLPLPLTWQKASAEGHDGSVVIGRIDGFNRVDGENSGLIEFWGVMLANPEADEVIGQLASFGKFGVSVDIDDATFDVDESGNQPAVWFSDARICSASVVSIPAFAEAFIMLGEHPSLQDTPTEPAPTEMANGQLESFARGPGWVTDPTDTKRIHDYWTVPGKPGFAKIGWGAGGDFDRCRVEVGKYLEPQYVNGTCAQWHHDALGIWPSTHAKALGGAHSLDGRIAPAMNLVASGAWTPPAAWFSDLALTELTRTTYVEHPEGTEVYGHMGEWRTCHLGIPGVCTEMPPSTSPQPYSVFHSVGGGLMTDEGLIDVGQLTLGGGHADTRLGLRPALAHYDDVSTVIADVRVGEDQFGIWFHGWVRPSVTEEQRVAFRASTLSGDWRMVKGHQELMLGHAVNMGGFPIVPQTSVIDGQQVALVAAGAIQGELTEGFSREDVERIVSDTINAREALAARRKLIEDIVHKHGADPVSRMARLRDRYEES